MKIKEIFGYTIITLIVIGIFVGIYWINLKPHYDKAATEKNQEVLLERQVVALEKIAKALGAKEDKMFGAKDDKMFIDGDGYIRFPDGVYITEDK